MTNKNYEKQPSDERVYEEVVKKLIATRNMPNSLREAVKLRGFDIIPDNGRVWTETQMVDGKKKRVKIRVVSLTEEPSQDPNSSEEDYDDPKSHENRYLVPKRGWQR